MFKTEEFEIWNLTPGQTIIIGSQSLFNIVGRVKDPINTIDFLYRLNQGKEVSIIYNISNRNAGRLERFGDFNIDTISVCDLKETNELQLRVERQGFSREWRIIFRVRQVAGERPQFSLDLTGISEPQEIGQTVDGFWQIGQEPTAPCLTIPPEEAGYDRVFLFGSEQWTSGYQIKARLEATALIHRVYLLGLLFKWGSHTKGDGYSLPMNWSTGLGIFDSRSNTLRIRYGIDVHKENGRKIGDNLLGEAPLRQISPLSKSYQNLFGRKTDKDQFELNKPYWFHLVVHPKIHSLAVWQDGFPPPGQPQVVVNNPAELLPSGSVGVIAYNCGIRVHNFEVSPYG